MEGCQRGRASTSQFINEDERNIVERPVSNERESNRIQMFIMIFYLRRHIFYEKKASGG